MSSSVHGAQDHHPSGGGEGGDKKGPEGEKEAAAAAAEKVPFLKLFSFADRWDYVLMAVGSLGACAHGASVPVFFIFFGKLINIIGLAYLFPTTVSGRVAKYSLDFVYLGIVILFSSWTEVACWMHTGERQAAKMRLAYLRSMLDQDIAVFDTEASTGEVINAITSDILVVQDAISEKKMFMKGYGGNLGRSYLKANMLAAEAVSNIRTVAAFCSEEKVIKLYADELKEPAKRSFRRGQGAGLFYGVSQFFLFSSYALALWYGSELMSRELASFKSVMKSFMVLIVTALAMGETLAMAPDIIKGNQMASSVFEILDRKTDVRIDAGDDVKRVEGVIQLRGVEFRYPSRPEVVVFKGLDLLMKAGKSMALVGMSGSGKSTVLSLILRFYDPIAGKVLIDGKDIKKLKLKSLRKHIGLVQQEPALFATTIYDNILYGKDGATEAEVIEAAKLANAHSFISSLPEGYQTKVGERGVQLSGGQKQRIAIARAIVKDPAILLLDEATSALDVESERVVQQALDRVMKNRTTVMVAHRLSTIKNADVISVIQDGKIIEQGDHQHLIENKNGAYHKLVSLQQQQLQRHQNT